MSRLKIGVVGAGKIFRGSHVPGWASHPDAELTALCDIDRECAETLAVQLGVARVYTDYREMLEQEELDAVDICTPNVLHSEVAIAALEHGQHVFCEKPDAISPEEAQRMADAASSSGKLLMAMRNNRFTPAARFLKAYIDSGAMGEIYTGRAGWVRRRGIPGRGGWFTNKAMSGGGPLIDLGVHMIDLAVWLMGNPRPVAVSGAAYAKFADSALSDAEDSAFGNVLEGGVFDVEDLATGFIRFDNGATLQIEFSWASNVEEGLKFVELRGTQAGCSLKNGDLKLMTEIGHVLCDIVPRFPAGGLAPHAEHIHHFIECVLGREKPVNDPEGGVDMIRILSAIYESAARGAEVRLD
ncbi:Predicted dehydrogenase [Paenibacillus sp. UNCCL117]|uniref:Gfo/Idh/MocA family protein n=1 Tax=unclassified Paenibacillus TaxID=185978 RepID=UPI00088608E8|nr:MULTISPECIES: Gfo/Idh/MocA family oxidoreductase [unclassified Paenibacillus]SDD47918.1 Predicted dehydrogenase [Paenibacillus sp. cl123]SFW50349.1 Predicted dehydrogenase [Paenibacillus sp. UNCCL117]